MEIIVLPTYTHIQGLEESDDTTRYIALPTFYLHLHGSCFSHIRPLDHTRSMNIYRFSQMIPLMWLNNTKPPIWDWFTPPISGDLRGFLNISPSILVGLSLIKHPAMGSPHEYGHLYMIIPLVTIINHCCMIL